MPQVTDKENVISDKKEPRKASDIFHCKMFGNLFLRWVGIPIHSLIVDDYYFVEQKNSLVTIYDFSSNEDRTYITFEYDINSDKILNKKHVTIRYLPLKNKIKTLEIKEEDKKIVVGLIAKLQNYQ